MEPEYRQLITKNLDQLVTLTICDELFLARFQSRQIFGPSDVEALRVTGRNGGRFAMSHKFYDIIQTKTGSFQILLDALRDTNQSGALHILDSSRAQLTSTGELAQLSSSDGFFKDSTSTPDNVAVMGKPTRFLEPPEYITQFLTASSKTVLLVNSMNCKITCDRICETTNNCKVYNFEEGISHCSSRSALYQASATIPVINCQGKEEFTISSLRRVQQKMVLVGKYGHNLHLKTPSHASVNDTILWSDLHPQFSYSIQQKIQSRFGLNSNECSILFQEVEQQLLMQLIEGDIPTTQNIFKDTLPDLIKYYIPRRLVTRSIVSSNIFSAKGTDIFLISGIERHELSTLAAATPTNTSTNVIASGLDYSTRFVVLEHESHFEKIVDCERRRVLERLQNVGARSNRGLDNGKPEERSIHLLQRQNEELKWLKSSAVTQELQDHICTTQILMSEQDVVQQLTDISNFDQKLVCISYTPGMGKSALLTHLAIQLKKEERCGIVAFVVISEFVEQCQKLRKTQDITHDVSRIIAENICTNKLGITYLLNNKNELGHLLLDGLDEVGADDTNFAYRLIKALQAAFPDTKMWITTRPHLLHELERSMNVLGYNIKEFEQLDQLNFLQSFWSADSSVNHTSTSLDKLQFYANACLSSIKSKINEDGGRDIAGIPLQCLLIGDVFEQGAREFSQNESQNDYELHFNVNSIADLYKQLVDKKFDTFCSRYKKSDVDMKKLMDTHIYYSICLLFPSVIRKFDNKLKCSAITLNDVFNVGIIESKSLMPVPRFVHRTLAEYFVALYVVQSFTSKKRKLIFWDILSRFNWRTTITDLLFKDVLICKKIPLPTPIFDGYWQNFTHEFSNSVICYFMNIFLDVANVDVLDISYSSMSEDKLIQISEACAYNNFENIFALFIYGISLKAKYKLIYSEKLVALCTIFSGTKMLSLACKAFSSTKQITDIRIRETSILHLAVIRGNYAVVEHLVNMHGFLQYISSFTDLVYQCAKDTYNEDKKIVREKLAVIKYVTSICPNLVIASNENTFNDPPLLADRAHVDIAKELLSSRKYKVDEIVLYLHRITDYYDSEDFNNVLLYITSENITPSFGDLWTRSIGGAPLAHQIFINMNPNEQMLSHLKSYGVDFSWNGESRQSVLELAISREMSQPCITWLLNNATFNHDLLQNVFVQAIQAANVTAVEALINGKHVAVDLVTDKNENMLQVLFNSEIRNVTNHYKIAKLLTQNGVSLRIEDADAKTLIDKLVKTITEQSRDWCILFALLLTTVHTTTYESQLDKARLLIRRSKYHDCTNFDETLLSDLRACIVDDNIVNKVDSGGNTLLHLVWVHGSLKNDYSCEMWKMLIDVGADPLTLNKENESPVFKLMQTSRTFNHRCLELFMYVISKVPIANTLKINNLMIFTPSRNMLPLTKSACNWFKDNVKQPINGIIGEYKGRVVTMLDMALLACDGDVLEYLVNIHGCSVALQPFNKRFLCMYLEKYYRKESQYKFVTLANKIYTDFINTPNESGRVPLSMDIGDAEHVRHLLKLGANVNKPDTNGNTPLHWALKDNRDIAVINVLLDYGADVNAVTSNSETPLMMAMMHASSWNKSENIFKILINKNAVLGWKDKKGNTVLHNLPHYFVNAGGYHEVAEHMLQKGYAAMWKIPGENGRTPLQIACEQFAGNVKVMELFQKYSLR